MALTTFVSGQILTAAQMNAVQANDYNQTVSTKTADYVLVAADKGTKVVMNSASGTTITVNTSLFSAGDTLTLLNIGAGVCTVTAGTATVSTTGSLALAQYGGGTLYFTSAGVAVFQADGATPGLTLVSSTTIDPTVSTVTVSGAFSATYDNYKIIVSGGASSTGNNLTMTLGATTTGYYQFSVYGLYNSNTVNGLATQNAANWRDIVYGTAANLVGAIDVFSPQLARNTQFLSSTSSAATGGLFLNQGGYLADSTQYTAFTLTTNSGTITGGTIKVYGYQNS